MQSHFKIQNARDKSTPWPETKCKQPALSYVWHWVQGKALLHGQPQSLMGAANANGEVH